MNIILGTTSTIKQQALEQVLKQYQSVIPLLRSYTIVPFEVESLVPDTPYNSQTYQGARNRACALFKSHATEGDLFIGLESGLIEREEMLFEECWCVVLTKAGKEHAGYSSGLLLPTHITSEMKRGKTHTEILRRLADKIGISSKDTWALYSHGALSRSESIQEALRNALLSIR